MMKSIASTRLVRPLLHRRAFSRRRRWLSSIRDDPGGLVSGLTPDQVEAHPEISAFLSANFADEENADDGITVPDEILREYGIIPPTTTTTEASTTDSSYGTPKVDLGLGSPAQQALNIRVLKSYLREEEGSRACRRLRLEHRLIPGALYGNYPTTTNTRSREPLVSLKTPWPEVQRELDRFHRKFESRVYDLTIYQDETDTEGTVHRVVPRDVQRHPVQGSIYCANFLRYHAGRPLKLPIVYINQEESPALKRDGFIVPINKYVECMVEDGAPIPEALELECTGIQIKDVIRIDRIIFPDGVRPSDRVDVKTFVVGPVQGGRGGADEDDDEGTFGETKEESPKTEA